MLPNPCHGEATNLTTDDTITNNTMRFRYDRKPLKIVNHTNNLGGITQGGNHSIIVLEGEHLRPASTSKLTNQTVLLFLHPAAIMNMLPFPAALARSGINVVTCHTRYANFDYSLILEECLSDVGCVVDYCRNTLDFEKVVLVGWSGGGSLMAYYQSMAETEQKYTKADAYISIAAHAGRARILTECLDPSIYLFRRGSEIDQKHASSLSKYNLYSKQNMNTVPSWTEIEPEFRQAQIDRNNRISQYAIDHPGQSFVVDGTMMDPRWLYPKTVDPNDRTKPFDCYLGDPRIANDSTTGLARFTCSESWLSQWSWKYSKGDGVFHSSRITIPSLFIENGADNGCPWKHIQDMFQTCASQDKEYVKIEKATHYYTNQKDKLEKAASIVVNWLNQRHFIQIENGVNDDTEQSKQSQQSQQSKQSKQSKQSEVDLEELRNLYDGRNAMEISSINHLALVSSDMERTCRFYGGVMGMKLTKTIDLPGGGQHFFFDFNSSNMNHPSSMAFFWFGDKAPPASPGSSAPSMKQLLETGQHPSAQGSMNHVAFNVPEKKLKEYRKRLVHSKMCSFVSPIVYHADTKMGVAIDRKDTRVTWCSVYFFGPDGELLEISSQTKSFEDRKKHVNSMPKKSIWRHGSGDSRRSNL